MHKEMLLAEWSGNWFVRQYAPLGTSYVIGWSENCDTFYLLWQQKQNLLLLVNIKHRELTMWQKNPEISVERQMEQ